MAVRCVVAQRRLLEEWKFLHRRELKVILGAAQGRGKLAVLLGIIVGAKPWHSSAINPIIVARAIVMPVVTLRIVIFAILMLKTLLIVVSKSQCNF